MFNQTTPQDYLNDMHAIGIPRLFHPKMNPRDRATGIQNAKKELGRLKVELQHHRDTLRTKNKKSSPDEVTRILAPYNLLQNLLQQLTEEVGGLAETLASGKMLPHSFEFGRYIFGDEEQAEWFVGEQTQYDEWLEAEDLKQRLDGFKEDGQPVLDKLAAIQSEFEAIRVVYQADQKKLDKRQKGGYILRRLALLFFLVIGCSVAGVYAYVQLTNPIGLVGFGLAGFFFLVMPFGYFDWKKRNVKLIATVREEKTQLRRLQLEGKDLKKKYQPIAFQIKSLEQQYHKLRADLVGGKQSTSVA